MLEITDDNFEEEVLSASHRFILVYLWADWCGPCKLMTPVLNEIEGEFERAGVKIYALNIGAHRAQLATYEISSIPVCLLFVEGCLVARKKGPQPRFALKKFITSHLEK
jgi:thioredoxin 1